MTDFRSPALRWSLLPIPGLLLLLAVSHFAFAPAVFYDPTWLILIGNTLFVGVVSFVVASIAWRNYLATGQVQVLLLGCAMLLFGIGGVMAAAVRGLPDGANLNVTVYNTGALLGALLHFAAALVLSAGVVSEAGPVRRRPWLALGYGGAVLFMALLTTASLEGAVPPFFIQGVGPTPLRQQVLGGADLLFVFSFFMFLATYLRKREQFLYWYAGGLALTAISLTAFLIERSVGSPVGWVGRCAQYAGGIYFLAALVVTGRSAHQLGAPFDDVLAASLTGAEERFRAAFANAAIGFAMTTPAGRYVDANPAYCALTGYSLSELRALDLPQLVHPDDCAANLAQNRRMLAGEIPGFTTENRYVRKGGQPVWVRKSVSLVRDAQGAPRWVVAFIEDITARRQAETALRESHDRMAKVLAVETVGVMFWDLSTGRMTDANDTFLKMMGYSRAQVDAGELTWQKLTPPEYFELSQAEVRKFMATGRVGPYEKEYLRQDGTRLWLVFAGSSLGSNACVEFCVDISARKAAEAEIEQLNTRLRRAMAETHHRVKNNLQVIAALIDMQGMTDDQTVPVSALERLGRHVRGLATIHDLLTQEARAGGDAEFVNVRDAIDKLRPLLENMVGGRELHFHVEDVRLPARQTTSLAVLINELVSNAVKHGGGVIDLSLAVVADRARLEVRDHGCGFPEGFTADTAANTGIELVQSLGTWDLQGEVAFANAPDGGACVTVRFPLGTEGRPAGGDGTRPSC